MRFDVRPAGPEHVAFVRDSFARSVREAYPYSWVPRPILVDDFRRRTTRPEATTLIAHVRGEPDLFLGWLVAVPCRNEVVFSFVKYAYRQNPDLRVSTTLAETAGIDLSQPTAVRYWTRAAQRIAHRPGYRLYHIVTEPGDDR